MIEDLIDTVVGFMLPKSAENPIVSKLNSALEKVNDDNPNNDSAAIGKMSDVIAITEAKRGKTIPDADADEIIAKAEEIIGYLELL